MSYNGAWNLNPLTGVQIDPELLMWKDIQKAAKTNEAVADRLQQLIEVYILTK